MVGTRIAIYGAGGFGREVAWLIELITMTYNNIEAVCFIDDDENICGANINDLEVLSLSQAKEKYPTASVISGIGVPGPRMITMAKASAAGFVFATLVHPNVMMSKWNEIGAGTVICAGNILTTNIKLGKHVQVNLDCTIGHDVVIDDYATISPGVHISGYVHIGKRVYIGTGAVIINGTKENPIVIEDDVIVGAGASVTKSIPKGMTWAGVPAKSLHH